MRQSQGWKSRLGRFCQGELGDPSCMTSGQLSLKSNGFHCYPPDNWFVEQLQSGPIRWYYSHLKVYPCVGGRGPPEGVKDWIGR